MFELLRRKRLFADAGKGRPAPPEAPGAAGLLPSPLLHICLIAVLGVLIYSNTFHSPFQLDERAFIAENPIIRDLGYFKAPSLAKGLPYYGAFASRYVGYLSFALNYRIHGLRVAGYHAVNIAIHIVNALLVYFLVLLTFRTPYFKGQRAEGGEDVKSEGSEVMGIKENSSPYLFALCAAVLFVVHPVQTEAVTYIFQRLASLVTMFYLLSIVMYIKGRLAGRRAGKLAGYLLSLVLAIVAMKTKENAFTLPVLIAIYEFSFFSGPVKTRVLRLLPLFLAMMIIPVTLAGTDRPAGEIIAQAVDPVAFGYKNIPPKVYLLTQLRVVVTYIRLLFLPFNQDLWYDYPAYNSLSQPPVMLSLLLLSAVFGTAIYFLWKSRQRPKGEWQTAGEKDNTGKQPALRLTAFYRLVAFGLLWFFVALSVESSIIPIPMMIDEYRIYLPSVGFFLAAAAGGRLLIAKIPASRGKWRVAAAGFCAVVIMLSAASYARNSVWRSRISLWNDVVQKGPGLFIGYNNLGLAYAGDGRRDEAIEMYKKSIELNPSYVNAYANLGVAYTETGRNDLALEALSHAVALDPGNAKLLCSLGSAMAESGRVDEAIEKFRTAIALDPASREAYVFLGLAFMKKGLPEEAISDYRNALALDPGYVVAHYDLGDALASEGRIDEAIEHYGAAAALEPGNALIRNALGIMYGRKGLPQMAAEQFEAAVRLAPSEPAYRNNLEKAYGSMNSSPGSARRQADN